MDSDLWYRLVRSILEHTTRHGAIAAHQARCTFSPAAAINRRKSSGLIHHGVIITEDLPLRINTLRSEHESFASMKGTFLEKVEAYEK